MNSIRLPIYCSDSKVAHTTAGPFLNGMQQPIIRTRVTYCFRTMDSSPVRVTENPALAPSPLKYKERLTVDA